MAGPFLPPRGLWLANCIIDLIAAENGQRVIWEHKTSARKYGEDKLKFDTQVTA